MHHRINRNPKESALITGKWLYPAIHLSRCLYINSLEIPSSSLLQSTAVKNTFLRVGYYYYLVKKKSFCRSFQPFWPSACKSWIWVGVDRYEGVGSFALSHLHHSPHAFDSCVNQMRTSVHRFLSYFSLIKHVQTGPSPLH